MDRSCNIHLTFIKQKSKKHWDEHQCIGGIDRNMTEWSHELPNCNISPISRMLPTLLLMKHIVSGGLVKVKFLDIVLVGYSLMLYYIFLPNANLFVCVWVCLCALRVLTRLPSQHVGFRCFHWRYLWLHSYRPGTCFNHFGLVDIYINIYINGNVTGPGARN